MRDLEKKKEYQKEYYLRNKEKLKEYRTNWYYENRELGIERSRIWAEKNRDRRKHNILKSSHNITLEDYNKMFENQDGCCKICGRHQSILKKPLFVDHCHTTGKIRGLLCGSCNSSLGFAKDDIRILENMIKYLQDASISYPYQN